MSEAGQVDLVGIVGAGFMGSGIAESTARAGISVVLHEPTQAPLDLSRERLTASVQRAVQRGKLSAQEAEDVLARITWTTTFDDLAGAGLVVEAIVENPEIKASLFERLDALVAPSALLASNTSSIPIAQLASATQTPSRVLGLHFFSPVPVMSLVEIVVALDTAPESVDVAEGFVRAIDKHPIRTKDRSGFLVNFLLIPYLNSAIRLLEDGVATREDIDEGMKRGCSHPMGPLELSDFIGLDVIVAICDSLFDEFRRPEYAAPPLLKRMVTAGHLGRKSGRGFYQY